TVMDPVVGASSPPIIRKRVVLPQPDGPSRDTKLPAAMSRSRGWRAVTARFPTPKTFDTPRSAIASDITVDPSTGSLTHRLLPAGGSLAPSYATGRTPRSVRWCGRYTHRSWLSVLV